MLRIINLLLTLLDTCFFNEFVWHVNAIKNNYAVPIYCMLKCYNAIQNVVPVQSEM